MQVAQTELRGRHWPAGERFSPVFAHQPADQTERPVRTAPAAIPLGHGCVIVPSRLDAPQTEYALPDDYNFVACSQHSARRITWRNGPRSQSARMRRGGVSLIPETAGGHLHCDDAISISSIMLSSDRLVECATGLGYASLPELRFQIATDDQRLAALIEMLTDYAVAGDSGSRMLAEQCLDLLCAHLIAHHSAGAQPDKPRQKRGLAEWQVDRVADYMQAHLDEAISLDDLAQYIGLSRFHFCTAFRIATGQTPYEWLTAKRMETAASLLAGSALSITEIGLSVGYETPSSFTARFRRQMGMTPTDFRRKAANVQNV